MDFVSLKCEYTLAGAEQARSIDPVAPKIPECTSKVEIQFLHDDDAYGAPPCYEILRGTVDKSSR